MGLLSGYLTFDKNDEKWAAEYKELSELLTPQEYAQARSTVNDAFYTSPTVIDGIYEALGNFGFEGGNVLDKAVTRLIQRIPQKGLISGLFANGRPIRSYFFALPPVR